MANPFLFEDVADYGDVTAAASSNPFLCGAEEPVSDNPFLTSVSTAPGTNPFADYSWDQPVENDPGFLTPPPISNINDPENDFIASSDDEVSKPTRPPPPRPSMPKETQDLILSVTGALKATSDHLLDRLPPTRAPSPTTFTDLHSPSPTPDFLGGDEDFLSLSQQPARPPPPRPPVRPTPPTALAVEPVPPLQTQGDMFDLFDAPPVPQPKSKDAILNLYSQPKAPPKDLMNDDDDPPLQAPLIMSTEPSVTLPEPITNVTSTTVVEEVPSEPESISADSNFADSNLIPEHPSYASVTDLPGAESEVEVVKTSEEANISQPPQMFGVTDEISSFMESNVNTNANSPVSITEPQVSTQPAEYIVYEEHDEAPQIFGVGPPMPEPVLQPSFTETVETKPKPPRPAPPPVEPRSYLFGVDPAPVESSNHLFGLDNNSSEPVPTMFGVGPPTVDTSSAVFSNDSFSVVSAAAPVVDAFDAFSAKFEGAGDKKMGGDSFDPFGGRSGTQTAVADTWGSGVGIGSNDGFGGDDSFDAFLSMSQPPPVPQPTPNRLNRTESGDSEEGGFNVFIKPREGEVYPPSTSPGSVPVLAPPPKSPVYAENDPRFNPFDKNGQIPAFPLQETFQLPALNQTEPYEGGFKRSDSQETPPTPLFDEDVSQPLEEFPRIHYDGEGWEMQLRHPNKKKITGQRFWKKIFVKLVYQGDNPVLQLFNLKEDKDPFQELPLQACYSVSEISAQQYDQFGKIFTVKLQYIFYKERPGVRPGQVTKAERITNKLSQFAAYAIQGDYQGVKEFGSDLKKLGLPVEHAPQISQLLKIGCMKFEDLKQFSTTIEECLFRMPVHRDRALTYKMEEVQITVVDEMYVEQDAFGHVEKQIARVRLFFLAFLSGMPDVELGMNDMWRQGKEVVGRHDIIPVVTEEWIRLESVEFHSCVQLDEYEKTRTIKFKPPDACYIELMRFRIRPPKNRELPLQLKAVMCVTGNRVELRADVLVPGFTSRKLGQIPCEDVMIRFPIPEEWIYLFRVEKHFRYGSVKSAHRRTGKIKGIERFLGAVDNLEPSLMEVTSGQAKYEHQHRAIVWRMPRLPKEGQGAYTTHNLVCRMQLTSYDQIPDHLADYAYVEFTMPATTASHTTVRSVSLVDSPSDNPPEKYVRQLARLEYRVGIEHTQGEEMASYVAATITKPKPPPPEAPSPLPAPSDSDSSG